MCLWSASYAQFSWAAGRCPVHLVRSHTQCQQPLSPGEGCFSWSCIQHRQSLTPGGWCFLLVVNVLMVETGANRGTQQESGFPKYYSRLFCKRRLYIIVFNLWFWRAFLHCRERKMDREGWRSNKQHTVRRPQNASRSNSLHFPRLLSLYPLLQEIQAIEVFFLHEQASGVWKVSESMHFFVHFWSIAPSWSFLETSLPLDSRGMALQMVLGIIDTLNCPDVCLRMQQCLNSCTFGDFML